MKELINATAEINAPAIKKEKFQVEQSESIANLKKAIQNIELMQQQLNTVRTLFSLYFHDFKETLAPKMLRF